MIFFKINHIVSDGEIIEYSKKLAKLVLMIGQKNRENSNSYFVASEFVVASVEQDLYSV